MVLSITDDDFIDDVIGDVIDDVVWSRNRLYILLGRPASLHLLDPPLPEPFYRIG